MRILRVVLVAILFPALLVAQEEVTYTVVMHPALDSLILNTPQRGNEMGWCVVFYTRSRVPRYELNRADTVIRVFLITRAPMTYTDRSNADFSCPRGTPIIHSHPADDDGRVACDASRIDHESLTADHRPFGIVWCAMPGTVTYKPWTPHDTTVTSCPHPVVGQGGSCRLPHPPDHQ